MIVSLILMIFSVPNKRIFF